MTGLWRINKRNSGGQSKVMGASGECQRVILPCVLHLFYCQFTDHVVILNLSLFSTIQFHYLYLNSLQ